MSSPHSEATSTFDVSIISQRVVQHLNDYIATNNASIEEYEQECRRKEQETLE